MLLSKTNLGRALLHHIEDHVWPDCQLTVSGVTITWMSAGISGMIVVAVTLSVVLIWMARRWREVPSGRQSVVEILVIFVRDMVARPALGEKAYAFLPYLMTLFMFLLGVNLLGIVPLAPILSAAGLGDYEVGGAATGILATCAGLAASTLLAILVLGLRAAARNAHRQRHWPMWLCAILSPGLWVLGLSPKIPGAVGAVLCVPLAILELVGALAKCFALTVRLFANVMAGHTLLAVLTLFTLMSMQSAIEQNIAYFGVTAVCVLAGALVCILELLVAALQAYVFTFLTAMFLGLYVESSH